MSTRCLNDTNVILDVFLGREPFLADSAQVLKLCEAGRVRGFITASSVTDLFCVVRRRLHSTEKVYAALGHVLNIVRVLPVTDGDVNDAFLRRARDFEDCLMAVCAAANGCQAIVTRNGSGFEGLGVPVITPEALVRSTGA